MKAKSRLHNDRPVVRTTRPVAPCRRGFSFVELLFAIMILGIGFILIAAIFPVAIRQTTEAGEQTVASTIAKEAVGYIQQYASNATMPATSFPSYATWLINGNSNANTVQLCSIGPQITSNGEPPAIAAARQLMWNSINGNMILPSDNRYAWQAMYMRTPNQPFAEVMVIACQVRNRTQYVPSVDAPTANYNPANTQVGEPTLDPKICYVRFTDNAGKSPDLVTFLQDPRFAGIHGPNGLAAVDGADLIVQDDPGNANATPPTVPTPGPSTANGYLYRIGNFVSMDSSNQATFQLMPGNDLQTYPLGTAGHPASSIIGAFIVGRTVRDPTQPYNPLTNQFEGLPQDIAVYTSIVRINK